MNQTTFLASGPDTGYRHVWKGGTLDIYAPDGSFRRAVPSKSVATTLTDNGMPVTVRRGNDIPGGLWYPEFADTKTGEVLDTNVCIAAYETILREQDEARDALVEDLGETTWHYHLTPEELTEAAILESENSTDREQSEDAQGQAQLANITPIFAGMAGPSDPF